MSEELKLDINPLTLDKEWQAQPSLYHEWAVKTAKAQQNYDEAKSQLDVVEAEYDKEIRDNPSIYGLTKITEAALAKTIILQPDYQTQIKKIHNTKHDLDVLKATVAALDHRKRALTLLVELWIRDYYSNPQLSTSHEAVDEMNKQNARMRVRRREEDARNDVDV